MNEATTLYDISQDPIYLSSKSSSKVGQLSDNNSHKIQTLNHNQELHRPQDLIRSRSEYITIRSNPNVNRKIMTNEIIILQ